MTSTFDATRQDAALKMVLSLSIWLRSEDALRQRKIGSESSFWLEQGTLTLYLGRAQGNTQLIERIHGNVGPVYALFGDEERLRQFKRTFPAIPSALLGTFKGRRGASEFLVLDETCFPLKPETMSRLVAACTPIICICNGLLT